ncbi:MAG: hypothetical protein AB1791_16510 [Chloroflexota bacterium]
MLQVKVSLEEYQVDFLSSYGAYGFKDKSSMVRVALRRLYEELEQQRLRQSADLYTEIYTEDDETRELTELAIVGWPE